MKNSWARLLARVIRIDVTECPHEACPGEPQAGGGRMKIIAAPPVAPPRPQPRTESDYPPVPGRGAQGP